MKTMAVLMSVILAWLCIFSGTPAPQTVQPAPAAEPVAETAQSAPAPQDSREARLLNMLSLNRVFGEELGNKTVLLEEAAVLFFDSAEEDESGFFFVDEQLVEGMVYNLYGVAANAEELNYEGFPKKDGKVMILPKGDADIEHTLVEVYEEENGILRVVTCAEIDPHDNSVYTTLAVTRFAPSEASSFGYVIISAELVA